MLIESLASDRDPYFEVIMDGNDRTSHPSSPTPHQSLMDDVWGSDNDEPAANLRDTNNSLPDHTDPAIRSDIPRLRSIHVTAGYRDGISSAKESSVQEGFDEGFAFGAEVGMAAGWILGILKGMERRVGRTSPGTTNGRSARGASSGSGDVPIVKIGVESDAADTSSADSKARVGPVDSEGGRISSRGRETSEPLSDVLAQLRGLAEQELSLKSLFSPDHIDSDGIWKYEVHSLSVGGEKQDSHDIAFREIALGHPLVSKWTEVIRRLMMTTVDKIEN